jgi:para-aminobenzoate synthetase component 1
MERDRFISEFNRLYGRGEPFLFITDFEQTDHILIPLEKAADAGILYNFRGATNHMNDGGQVRQPDIRKYPVDFNSYAEAFAEAQKRQIAGDSYLLNLTFPTKIEIDMDFSEIFAASNAEYKLKYKDEFVFFSPESFVRIADGYITASPMKGTRAATSDQSERLLMEDQKELAEHITVVDLLRNDLNSVSDDVEVTSFRYPTYIRKGGCTLIQTSTDIRGRLRRTDDMASVVLGLLPAGSVSGAPKRMTLDIIRSAEGSPRGFYTGVAGIYDGGGIDTCVIIRYIERKGGEMFFRSGGGITVYSRAEDEYAELLEKVYVPVV